MAASATVNINLCQWNRDLEIATFGDFLRSQQFYPAISEHFLASSERNQP